MNVKSLIKTQRDFSQPGNPEGHDNEVALSQNGAEMVKSLIFFFFILHELVQIWGVWVPQ